MAETLPLTPILDEPDTPEPAAGDGGGDGGGGIRCPLCAWSPRSEDRWACHCGHTWNTFDTGGVCPGCLLRWAYTACPQCETWSLHSDWYRGPAEGR